MHSKSRLPVVVWSLLCVCNCIYLYLRGVMLFHNSLYSRDVSECCLHVMYPEKELFVH